MEGRPRMEWAEVAPVATRFGAWVLAKELPSERDRNFLLSRADSSEQAVFKVHNYAEEPAFVDCQDLALRRCGDAGAPCQRSVRAESGESVVTLQTEQGSLLCRMLSYIPGDMLDAARWREEDASRRAELWTATGCAVGAVAAALDGFEHAAAPDDFVWDLRRFESVVAEHAGKVESEKRFLLDALLASFREDVGPLLPALRVSVVHNDPNDFNLVVLDGGEVAVLDFGDMCRSYTVADAAICAAYLLFACPPTESLAASIAPFVAAFHAKLPLQEAEIRAVFGLAAMRLCTSVCMSAHQCSLEPDNEYLSISAAPAWELLARLAAEPRPFGEASQVALLRACGFGKADAS